MQLSNARRTASGGYKQQRVRRIRLSHEHVSVGTIFGLSLQLAAPPAPDEGHPSSKVHH